MPISIDHISVTCDQCSKTVRVNTEVGIVGSRLMFGLADSPQADAGDQLRGWEFKQTGLVTSAICRRCAEIKAHG